MAAKASTSPEDVEKQTASPVPNRQRTNPTTYCETLTHLFKGNVGPGLFAMGDAFKNGGLIVAPILTIIISLICVHCEHILVNCSNITQNINKKIDAPDYAETVELVFEIGPQMLRPYSSKIKTIVNIFICVTQYGFCCIYFVFISTNFKQMFDHYGINLNVKLVMAIIFIPILLPSLLTKLKYLAPVSSVANFCMITGIMITIYFAFDGGLPNPMERHLYTTPSKLALYFGTVIFAFEGIALVLPLKAAMKHNENFEKRYGVLNVGMLFVTLFFSFAGFFGYLKWGEDVGGSLTLNLDVHNLFAQYVKIAVSIGVLLGYPLQFFIAIQIMWPAVQQISGCYKNPFACELFFRFFMVIITFVIALLVPNLSLFISLVGALCSTTLALVFPPLIDLILKSNQPKGIDVFSFLKNFFILILALIGFSSGSYESISEIIEQF